MTESTTGGAFRWRTFVREGTLPHTDISSGSRLRIVAKWGEHPFILENWGAGLYFSVQNKD
jgi:hypothetical protein